MPNSTIPSLTVSSLKSPITIAGDFGILLLSSESNFPYLSDSFTTKFYALIIPTAGKAEMVLDGTTYEIKRGRVCFINYNQVLRIATGDSFIGRMILFTKSFYNLIYTGNRKIKNDTAFSGLPAFAEFKRPQFTEFLVTVSDVAAEAAKQQPLSRELVCLLLKVTMLKYIRASGGENYIGFKTNRTLAYVEEFETLVNRHFRQMKRTSEYAEQLSITPNYLNAVVKDRLDLTAEQYIQNRVILEAERLLLNTNLSVTEIAFDLGFTDKSHFGKYFKKSTGESPNRFRQKFITDNKQQSD